MTLTAGTRLGPYGIVESIGAGGMGEVWRARDTRLDRDVAIKILPPGFADNEQFVQRFEREARTISSLNHPHICILHDVGEHDGSRYLVMELIEGESLADRLKKGPLPLHDVLKYGRQTAAALDAAHKRGVIHRDLKPGNIMITRSGAKLLDFGLAKSSSEGRPAIVGMTNVPTEAKPLTREGTILGTFQYMAPEQLEGAEADARTDIFALGAVLYEMATGRRAFRGETKTSLIAAIVSHHPEPISQVVPMTPPALDHVVRRCLEKDPDDRWQSAQDIASELQWISEAGSQAGVAAPVTLRRRTRERLAWALAALLAIACATLGFLVLSRSGNEPIASLDLSLSPPKNAYYKFGNEYGGAIISPDGKRIVFAAETSEGPGLWIRSLGRDDARPIPGTKGASYPFWSPDSGSVAFFDYVSGRPLLKRIELAGGLPVTITSLGPNGDGRGGSWRSDGLILCGTIAGILRSVPAAGGQAVIATTLDSAREETAHYWPQFVGGGSSYLYFVRSNRKDLEGLYLGTLGPDGKEASRKFLVASAGSGQFVPGESATRGHLIWPREGRLLARPFDVEKGELSGETSDLGVDVAIIDAQRGSLFSTSSDGTTWPYLRSREMTA
jgi:serine/threonine protein kinase